MNAMSLPEEEARALGVPTGPLRAAVVAAATLVTAASVSAAGVIGWVGLVVPHLARFLVGPSFPRLMPAAAILGGGYLLLIDTLARSLAPVEIPLGILTAVIGTPFFIALLRQARARTMPVKSPSRRVTPALSIATSPDASERSERGAADNQEALYSWGGPGRMGEIGRERLLCGHTHGGQICLPGGIPVMTDADSPRALARGAWRYHDMAGYTSAGTGTCIVDVRLNCPSEVTLHRLRLGAQVPSTRRSLVVVRKQANRGDAAINITRADFHGEWNYTIQPSNRSKTSVDP